MTTEPATNQPTTSPDISFRPAVVGDLDRLNFIFNDPPNAGTLKIAGSYERVMRATRKFFEIGLWLQLEHTTVAVAAGEAVGFMDASADRNDPDLTPATIARLLPSMILAVGPAAVLRSLRSRPAYARVGFPGDRKAYHIAEIDVSSSMRNRGIGARFLALAEERARSLGCPRMTLSTDITNPAQHLYERAGFRITQTKRDRSYEYWSGSPGRVWMVRDLE